MAPMASLRSLRRLIALTTLVGWAMLPVSSQTPAPPAAQVPELAFESVADPLTLPPDIHFGEIAGVATNSKGHVFVFSRGNVSGPAYMTQAVLGFNEQLERLGEVAIVFVLGALLWEVAWTLEAGIFIAVLLLVIRPLATAVSLVRSPLSWQQRAFIGWFGVRGVGSVYYLAFAVTHGAAPSEVRTLADLTLMTVAASVVVHGISVTPLMRRYARRSA
jgi:NhaP-type Na+/H+ or K+/H+ antiporter